MSNEAEKIYGNVTGFLSGLWTKLKPEIKSAAVTALQQFEQKLTPDAINLMDDAVEYTATIGLTDVAAREAAIQKFVTDGAKAGVDVAAFAKNELNALVEISVVALKGKLSAIAPASSTAGSASSTAENPPATA